MKTTHKILYQDAQDLKEVASDSVDLVVTSPPYPMIDMWDDLFSNQNPEIRNALEHGDGKHACELMHEILDSVWNEVFRVLKNGRFACINIGDATRNVKDNFCLYPNHARILNHLLNIGFTALPNILWHKKTNAPTKFMGSGVLPAGAYVTLEHEYILIVRKGPRREFKTEDEKVNRRESALFYEERNIWYSDIWTDIKGKKQDIANPVSRSLIPGSPAPRLRSAAFPFDLAYRLINMYSVKDDVILDPFLGTGTTTEAAMTSGRNSIGVEIEEGFQQTIGLIAGYIVKFSNKHLHNRLLNHLKFVKNRIQDSGPLKHKNKYYDFPVVMRQEQSILLNDLTEVQVCGDNTFEVTYSTEPEYKAYNRGKNFEKTLKIPGLE